MNENVVKLENNFNQVIERKIAVILVTDVVGFSKLMEINEDETFRQRYIRQFIFRVWWKKAFCFSGISECCFSSE